MSLTCDRCGENGHHEDQCLSPAKGSFAAPTGSQRCACAFPCLVDIRKLAGLEAVCEGCQPWLEKYRAMLGWEAVEDTPYHMSDKITDDQFDGLMHEIGQRRKAANDKLSDEKKAG